MNWLVLSLRVSREALPRAEALLELAGASAISLADATDSAILEPAPGATPLWPSLVVRALFDGRAEAEAASDAIVAEPGTALIGIEQLSAKDFVVAEPATSETIGPRLRLVPAEGFEPGDPRDLAIHRGLAFGTGAHPTTRLVLRWLERELRPGATVLDYGCGSGILALAALRLGASHATAIDNEPQALAATRRNAGLNGLAGRLRVGTPDAPPARCDTIVANILAGPLIDRAAHFAEIIVPRGRIALSGLLLAQLDAVQAHYSRWFTDFDRQEQDGWGLLTANRHDV